MREDLWIYVALITPITPITLIALNDLGNKKSPTLHRVGCGTQGYLSVEII